MMILLILIKMVMDLIIMMRMMLPKTHPKPIVVEIFIPWFFKGKSGVVAGCVAHPCDQHLPQGRVDVEEEGPGMLGSEC